MVVEIIYYDSEEFEEEFSPSKSFVLKNVKPVPAGVSIFSMPDTAQTMKWKSFADKYDIHFIFDDAIPEVNFYAVPHFHIMATDSNGGLIGIVGGKDSLNTDLPIGYVSPNHECFLVSPSGNSFLENINQWKQFLKPYSALMLFNSKEMAKKEKNFLDLKQIKYEMEEIKKQLKERKKSD